MHHIRISEVDKYKRSVSPYKGIGESEIATFFFGGSGTMMHETPNNNIIGAISDYVLDHSFQNAGLNRRNKLYFVTEQTRLTKDDYLFAVNQEIEDFNAGNYQHNPKAQEFASNILAPDFACDNIVSDTNLESRRASVDKLKLHLSRINLLGFCYGTLFIQECLLELNRILAEKGYSDTERTLIKESLSVVNLAPICSLIDSNLHFGQIFFATEQDSIIKRRIDYGTLGLETTHDLLHTYSSANSLLLVSHLVSEQPLAIKVSRRDGTFKFGDNPYTVSTECTYESLLKLIEQGKVDVRVIEPKHDDDEKTGHSIRRYLNTQRLIGVQDKGGQIFTFRTALGVRTTLDCYQRWLNQSDQSIETGKPKSSGLVIKEIRESLTQSDIDSRAAQFLTADGSYEAMIELARKKGALIEKR